MALAKPSSPYTYDPEKAKQLLAQAGYAKGLDIGTISAIPFGGGDKLAQALQQNLADVGITSKVQLGEFSSVISDMRAGNYDIISMGTAEGMDFQAYQMMYGTGASDNFTGSKNTEVDSLFTQAAQESDLAARKAINQKIVDLVTADAYYIPFIYPISPAAWNKDLVVDQAYVYIQPKYMHWK